MTTEAQEELAQRRKLLWQQSTFFSRLYQLSEAKSLAATDQERQDIAAAQNIVRAMIVRKNAELKLLPNKATVAALAELNKSKENHES